jgi:hypothetical protein
MLTAGEFSGWHQIFGAERDGLFFSAENSKRARRREEREGKRECFGETLN